MCPINCSKLSSSCGSLVIICESCLTVGITLDLVPQFPHLKPGEEQLDYRTVQRLFTRRLMRYKILPWVPLQSQYARNIFTGDILVFNTVVFDCKAKQLACILSHPLLVLWLPMIYWTTVCLRSVCTVGMTAPPSCGRKELGAKDFPLCQSHRRSWKHWLVWLTSQC